MENIVFKNKAQKVLKDARRRRWEQIVAAIVVAEEIEIRGVEFGRGFQSFFPRHAGVERHNVSGC